MTAQLTHSAERFMGLMERLKILSSDQPPPKQANISHTQLAMINFIAENPNCGVQCLAEGLKLSTASISVSVRQLEESGYLQRQPHPQDGRAVLLSLTPLGADFQTLTLQFRRQMFERLLAGLSEEERDELITLLNKAVQSAESTLNN